MPASSKTTTELSTLIPGYRLCALSEGKSQKTIDAVADSVRYLERFLASERLPTDAAAIGPNEIRAFILYLQQKRCFSEHPFAKVKARGLSKHTINCYLRSIRAFWSWLLREEITETSPFARVKVPSAPRKVVPTLL